MMYPVLIERRNDYEKDETDICVAVGPCGYSHGLCRRRNCEWLQYQGGCAGNGKPEVQCGRECCGIAFGTGCYGRADGTATVCHCFQAKRGDIGQNLSAICQYYGFWYCDLGYVFGHGTTDFCRCKPKLRSGNAEL